MPNVAILYRPTEAHPMVLEPRHVIEIAMHNKTGEVRWYQTEEEILEDGFDAEVLIAWGRDTPDAVCDKMTDLKWIQSLSAGYEGLAKLRILQERDVVLSKMKGIHGFVMAETCLAYILCFLRSFPLILERKREHLWQKPELAELRECRDTTVGIIGMGDIGSRVAYLCRCLGMTVLGCRRSAVQMEDVDEMYTLDCVDKMLERSDFVVNLIPDTPGTRRMIGGEFFTKMKPSAVFINIGRGATVDTKALEEALENGVIAGAAIDAVDPEPLNEDSPLWNMSNVILTPHCSADSPNYFDRAVKVISDNLESYRDGHGVPGAV